MHRKLPIKLKCWTISELSLAWHPTKLVSFFLPKDLVYKCIFYSHICLLEILQKKCNGFCSTIRTMSDIISSGWNSLYSEFPTRTDTAASGGMSRTVRTALLISVPVAVTLLVLMFVTAFTCKKNRKPHRHVRVASNSEFCKTACVSNEQGAIKSRFDASNVILWTGHGDEKIGSLEPIQYNLSTLRSVTDNFSEQNKLGQGAFGPVYKVNKSRSFNIKLSKKKSWIARHSLSHGVRTYTMKIWSRCSSGYATKWTKHCSEEIVSNIAPRAGGDDQRDYPGCKAPAQEPRAPAWLLHWTRWKTPSLRVPQQ